MSSRCNAVQRISRTHSSCIGETFLSEQVKTLRGIVMLRVTGLVSSRARTWTWSSDCWSLVFPAPIYSTKSLDIHVPAKLVAGRCNWFSCDESLPVLAGNQYFSSVQASKPSTLIACSRIALYHTCCTLGVLLFNEWAYLFSYFPLASLGCPDIDWGCSNVFRCV